MSWFSLLLYSNNHLNNASKLARQIKVTKTHIHYEGTNRSYLTSRLCMIWSLTKSLLSVKSLSASRSVFERHPSSGDQCHDCSLQESSKRAHWGSHVCRIKWLAYRKGMVRLHVPIAFFVLWKLSLRRFTHYLWVIPMISVPSSCASMLTMSLCSFVCFQRTHWK